jgi:hypothetical protein
MKEHELFFLEKENIPNVLHAKWQQKLSTGFALLCLAAKVLLAHTA